jgi:hypothetical protein
MADVRTRILCEDNRIGSMTDIEIQRFHILSLSLLRIADGRERHAAGIDTAGE